MYFSTSASAGFGDWGFRAKSLGRKGDHGIGFCDFIVLVREPGASRTGGKRAARCIIRNKPANQRYTIMENSL
jgi:hypothetical protein